VASGPGRELYLGPGKFLAGLVDELIAYAEHEFRLEAVREDGASLADHLASAQRQLAAIGKKLPKPAAESPQCPPELLYLLGWFRDLHAGRGSNGVVPNRLTPSDILDGIWLYHRVVPEPWEARALRALDAVWVGTAIEAQAKFEPKPAKPGAKRK
jgi:hypothetical protein